MPGLNLPQWMLVTVNFMLEEGARRVVVHQEKEIRVPEHPLLYLTPSCRLLFVLQIVLLRPRHGATTTNTCSHWLIPCNVHSDLVLLWIGPLECLLRSTPLQMLSTFIFCGKNELFCFAFESWSWTDGEGIVEIDMCSSVSYTASDSSYILHVNILF